MTHIRISAALPLSILLLAALHGCATAPASSTQTPSAAVAPAPAVSLATRVENAVSTAVSTESAAAVAVNDFDGLILITGQVLSEEEKSKVSNAVAFSAGSQLRRLSNELRVVEQIDLSTAESDAALATAANDLLASTAPSLAEQTEAVVENSTVFLMGRVTRAQGDAAAQLVSALEGVAAVKVVLEYID